MPSPVGHALGGLTAAFLINAFARRPALTVGLLAASAAMAVAPDLDILVGVAPHLHAQRWAVAIVAAGSLARFCARALRARPPLPRWPRRTRSHLALDWTSKDTSLPSGLTALWPFTSHYYKSGLDLFGEISRRYWLPDEFIIGNVKAAMWEFVLLAPCLFLAWVFWSKRTLTTKNETGKTNTTSPTR